MKKYFWMMTLALATGLFAGCEKNEPCTCQKPEPCHFNKVTIDMPVTHEEWKFDDVAHQFYVRFNVSAITEEVYDYGEISVSREMTTVDGEPCQANLPLSLFLQDPGSGDFYTQHIDYRVGIGFIEVQLTNSDWAYETDKQGYIVNPESMLFRAQLTY